MEFRFNLNDIFKEPFVEIGNGLIPPGFTGDKRALWDTQSKITQIVNAMGEASAHAQGLSKPITTADRLRNSEHKLYLLIDQAANSGKGAVTGMLKTGEKGLYVFDREGQHYQVSPPCVLDFYIHESRQRSGYGKGLFEHMLQTQQIEPVKMAIDRPSDKLLGFLNKHYGLNSPVKQMNNYVVYDGFFPKSSEASRAVEVDKSYTPGKKQSANGLQHGISSSPYGRYGAPRPPCSMGQIIHNDTAVIKRNQEPTGERPAQNSTPKADRPQSLNIETVENREMKNNDQHKVEAELYEADAEAHEPLDGNYEDDDSLDGDQEDLEALEQNFEKIDVAPKETTPLSKGSRSPGMEAAGIVTPGRNTPGLTDQGYFDLKFYHNKLW